MLPVLNLLQRAPDADWVHPEWSEWGDELPRRLTLAERIKRNSEPLRDMAGRALRELSELRDLSACALVHGRMPDAELRMLAQRRADHMGGLIDAIDRAQTPAAVVAWLNGHLGPLQGGAWDFGDDPAPEELRGALARARCDLWWRRRLRRAAVRHRETEANAAGEVNARQRQPYVTHDTAHRHRLRRAANADMMAATELENEAGQVMTLADLAATTTGNKAIRRGELMTRISGCERLAESQGMRGVFLTLTAPSRFHAVHRHGGKNERHDGSTPRDAQHWLCAAWARARAKLHRLGLLVFGFRVAEPHHDGCPHWHALLWCRPAEYVQAVEVIRAAWLKLEGDEPGAAAHRCKAVDMHAGGASGYIAKYIAKNIDDAGAVGAEGHRDDDYSQDVPAPAQADAFGGTAQRVEAWASAWGIRQFQAIGQPPVTVWRELRRVPLQGQGGATLRLAQAFEAVNRDGMRRADWAAYVMAQGGLWTGRRYLLRIAAVLGQRVGRYETGERPMPRGVVDSTGPGDWHLSNRLEWKPRGAWSKAEQQPARGPWAPRPAVHPWTRVNNCTRRAPLMIGGRLARDVQGDAALRQWIEECEPGAVSASKDHHGRTERSEHGAEPGAIPRG